MENKSEDRDFQPKSSEGFLRSESIALLLIGGYFVIMISVGIMVWYKARRKLRKKIELHRFQKPQCFDQDNNVLKIRYFGINSCESLDKLTRANLIEL